ncbi:unnamed protein product [Ascophyllum nodosum]
MSREATTVPLRLDAREREILGVLTRALNQTTYTDEVDTDEVDTDEGKRLDVIGGSLNRFFTSIWGSFTASGVSATPMRMTTPPQSKDRQGGGSTGNGELPFDTSASGANDAAAPKGKGCGATWYRADSFPFQKSNMGLTKEWASAIRTCCEIGRRHKIMNPEKMRGSYGMLMYILMDAQDPLVKQKTGFSCVRPMRTAHGLSQSSNLLGLFEDPDLILATRSVLPWHQGQVLRRPAKEIAAEAREKVKARKRLLARHGKEGLEGEVSLIIDSFADSIVHRDMTTRPIKRMLALLKANWTPDVVDEAKGSAASLAIRSGEHGARLTHDHGTQLLFVEQSLHLWLAIVDHMLELGAMGERTMIACASRYSLEDTGQGLQRVQAAPKLGGIMRKIQQRIAEHTKKPWVGSSAIHLGDNCVPNALIFLDKYYQVSTILSAILQVVDYLDDLDEGKDPEMMEFIQTRWQTVDGAKRHILHNFFTSGFDGSGADNNYDAGSCVDGRLTSVWNWCSKLDMKDFHHVFMCSGFLGFDGDFSC